MCVVVFRNGTPIAPVDASAVLPNLLSLRLLLSYSAYAGGNIQGYSGPYPISTLTRASEPGWHIHLRLHSSRCAAGCPDCLRDGCLSVRWIRLYWARYCCGDWCCCAWGSIRHCCPSVPEVLMASAPISLPESRLVLLFSVRETVPSDTACVAVVVVQLHGVGHATRLQVRLYGKKLWMSMSENTFCPASVSETASKGLRELEGHYTLFPNFPVK